MVDRREEGKEKEKAKKKGEKKREKKRGEKPYPTAIKRLGSLSFTEQTRSFTRGSS